MKLTQLFQKNQTPQSQPILGSTQVPNHAGGFAWAVDEWTLLDRFLILGSEEGTYYVNARKLSLDHAENVIKLIQKDGLGVVRRVVEVAEQRLAPRVDPSIFALALAASFGDAATKAEALAALPRVATTGTHLFQFAETVQGLRGWGRGLRRAIGNWYNAQPAERLEYGLVKYQNREGWSHRDLMRLAHPIPATEAHAELFRWTVRGEVSNALPLVNAVRALFEATPARAATLIRAHRIPREAVPSELLRSAEVWEALLDEMPSVALLRNLGNLSKVGVLVPNSDAEARVVGRLHSLRGVHPIAILNAQATYAKGRGLKGDGEWIPVASVVDALQDAFLAGFREAPVTGKRLLLGIDVSGSMRGTRVAGLAGLDCSQAAAAMTCLTVATEPHVEAVAFDTKAYAVALGAKQRLDDVTARLAAIGGGGTDCAAPIRFATKHGRKVDAFVIYTDSETWAGTHHVSEALAAYRKRWNADAKLAVIAMASTATTVADPSDARSLNVVGFDANAPAVLAQFLRDV